MSAELNRDDADNNDHHESGKSVISSRQRQVLGEIGAAGLASVFGLTSTEIGAANDNTGEMLDHNGRLNKAYETRMALVNKLKERGIPSMDDQPTGDEEESMETKVARSAHSPGPLGKRSTGAVTI